MMMIRACPSLLIAAVMKDPYFNAGSRARHFAAEIIGYLVGYANLTNTRSLALLGDPDASAYELLFSFSSPEEKNEFLNLVCSNKDMGKDYIIELTPLTTEEIRNARLLATVPP